MAVSAPRRSSRALALAVLSVATMGAVLALAGSAAASKLVFVTEAGDQSPSVVRQAPAAGGAASVVVPVESGHWVQAATIDTAANRVYWVDGVCDPNCSAAPRVYSIKFADLSGAGGVQSLAGSDDLGKSIGSLSIDRAAGRLYWAAGGDGNLGTVKVGYTALDGSGSGVFRTSAGITSWTSVVVDPSSGLVWWEEGPSRLVFNEPIGGSPSGPAQVTMPTQGQCGLTGGSPDFLFSAVDSVANRLYFSYHDSDGDRLVSTDLAGADCRVITASPVPGELGTTMAIDTRAGYAYLPNWDAGAGSDEGAVARQSLATPFGREWVVPWASADDDSTGIALLVKAPSVSGSTGAMSPTGTITLSQQLSCSAPQWESDLPGVRVFQAPASTSYAWQRDGTDIAGATGSTYSPTEPGVYTCAVEASNWAGTSRVAASGSATVAASGSATVKACDVLSGLAKTRCDAKEQRDAAVDRARAVRDAALAKCAVKKGAAKASCQARARAVFTRASAVAVATQTRTVALATCATKKGTAKASCARVARAQYTLTVALARAVERRDVALAACASKRGAAKASCRARARAAYTQSAAKARQAYTKAAKRR